ncbi:hypothetical protein MKW92_004995 [Papaver armeniacum]|nr:hypothetical protein MKW92_004995 [Papaver armeniacum]
MDIVLVISSLIRPFLVNPDPLAGALGLKLRLLNVAELLVFQTCIHSCLEYLEVVPWIGEKEEEKVNVASDVLRPPIDTLTHIIEVVLKNSEEEGRSEGQSLVLKLLRENKNLLSDVNANEICNRNIYTSCQSCLNSLLNLFKQAAESGYIENDVIKQISREADNLLWLLDILADRQAADEFALMWATQQELATLHSKFYTSNRYLASCITARLFVNIGSGKILTTKDTRQLYYRHGCSH